MFEQTRKGFWYNMARVMTYSYLDVVISTDTSNLSEEEFNKQLEEEKEELKKNWKGWEELD